VILELDRKATGSASELKAAVRSASKDRPLLLLIERDGRTRFITMAP
jgi:hypothetical protein